MEATIDLVCSNRQMQNIVFIRKWQQADVRKPNNFKIKDQWICGKQGIIYQRFWYNHGANWISCMNSHNTGLWRRPFTMFEGWKWRPRWTTFFMFKNACTSTVFSLGCVIALIYQVPLPYRITTFHLKTLLKLLAIDLNTKMASAYQWLSGTLKNAKSL